MANERREYERLSISMPINYETLETPEKRCGETSSKDISQGGIKIILDRFYPHQTKFLLKVNLENVHRVIESIAETVWSFNEPYSNRYCAGLRFTEMNRENRNILKQYLSIHGL